MPNQSALAFAHSAQSKADLLNNLAQIEVSDELVDRLNSVAECSCADHVARGENEADEDLSGSILEVSCDELTDAELELIWGGGITQVAA